MIENVFLNGLQASGVQRLAWDVHMGIHVLTSKDKHRPVGEVMLELSKVHVCMRKDPLALDTALEVAKATSLSGRLQNDKALVTMETRIQQQMIMASHSAVFSWVEGVFLAAKCTAPESSWASTLILTLDNQCEVSRSKASDFPVSSKLFLPALPPKLAMVSFPRNIADRGDFIQKTFIMVVQQWLGYQTGQPSPEHFIRYRWVSVLQDTFGNSILLLPEVWNAWVHFKTHVLEDHRIRPLNMAAAFDHFLAKLNDHPAVIPGSPFRLVLEQVDRLFTVWKQTLYTPDSTLTDPTPAVENNALSANGPHVTAADVMFETAIDKIKSFLLLSLQAMDPQYHGPYTKAQQHIRHLPDRYLPLRELSPSRVHASKPGGAFQSSSICTQSGSFSGACFRGCLFNSKAMLLHPGYFEDLDAWNEFIGAHPEKSKNFFCNQSAYGPCAKARGIDNVPAFWKLSEKWPKFLSNHSDKPTFLEIESFFKKFPSIGDLAAFLLATDIVLAGVGLMPPPEAVGRLIFKMKKGGYNGMVKVGLIPAGADEQTTVDAFCHALKALDIQLTKDQKDRMVFNMFTLEHSFCKRPRLAKLKGVQL